MSQARIIKATTLLVDARRSGRRLDALPEDCRPQSVTEAHAVQEAVLAALGESAAGWKANAPKGQEPTRGILLQSMTFANAAQIPAALVPTLGIEGEIAFRVDRDLGPREAPYVREDIVAAVTPFPAIEILHSRFADAKIVSAEERIADNFANGAFVHGPPFTGNWRAFDLSKLKVTLSVGGKILVEKVGGHPTTDPLLPAVALANALRHGEGLKAGKLVTTGSCTGVSHVTPGDTVTVTFEHLGSASVTFTR